jgi:hypothetical protein
MKKLSDEVKFALIYFSPGIIAAVTTLIGMIICIIVLEYRFG